MSGLQCATLCSAAGARGFKIHMDKIAGLKEILAMDPGNAFARYGLAMEYVNRGEIEIGLAEFDALLAANPDYTAGYQMARRRRWPSRNAIQRRLRG